MFDEEEFKDVLRKGVEASMPKLGIHESPDKRYFYGKVLVRNGNPTMTIEAQYDENGELMPIIYADKKIAVFMQQCNSLKNYEVATLPKEYLKLLFVSTKNVILVNKIRNGLCEGVEMSESEFLNLAV